MTPYVPPTYGTSSFNCPHCKAFAQQHWHDVVSAWTQSSQRGKQLHVKHTVCAHWGQYSIWHFGTMLYPANLGVEPPNDDLPYEVKTDYQEAAEIVDKSPRAAAALLRLGVQKLCAQLGEKGKNLNDDIASLVKKGLPAKIQQSLDIVRVVGNNAVHPGQLDLKDDQQTATALFNLINLIAEAMITQPKQVESLYQSLPQTARDSITQRDEGTVQRTDGVLKL